ncbi:hypothetical protein WJX73_005271 [Symbiochloris irregularis]|uniref:Uncharacterized protein n=1 Tax=Symbiochloris irregularis TaxID=706552 RepID=A0AAW1PSC4_9CHLO
MAVWCRNANSTATEDKDRQEDEPLRSEACKEVKQAKKGNPFVQYYGWGMILISVGLYVLAVYMFSIQDSDLFSELFRED